jgi:hypothetical protein
MTKLIVLGYNNLKTRAREMRNFKVTVSVLVAVLLGLTMVNAGEIVLQNGLNGYQGCTDTHIDYKPAFTTFTQSDTLKTEHFYTAC